MTVKQSRSWSEWSTYVAAHALTALVLVSTSLISYVYAQTGGGNVGGCPAGTLCNPLKVTSISDFLIAIIDILLLFAVPIIILFIVYGGFLLVTARGNTSQIESGKTAITWAVIGGTVVLGAKLIIEVVQGTVNQLKP